MKHASAAVAIFLLAINAAEARSRKIDDARVTYIPVPSSFIPLAPIEAFAGANFIKLGICLTYRAWFYGRQGKQIPPWEALDCFPFVGKGLAYMYKRSLPRLCANGPGSFAHHFPRHSVYLTDHPQEWYDKREYKVLCGKRWGKPYRNEWNDY